MFRLVFVPGTVSTDTQHLMGTNLPKVGTPVWKIKFWELSSTCAALDLEYLEQCLSHPWVLLLVIPAPGLSPHFGYLLSFLEGKISSLQEDWSEENVKVRYFFTFQNTTQSRK